MMRIDKCISDTTCVMLTLHGFVTILTEEDQKYFVDWIKKNKPDLI